MYGVCIDTNDYTGSPQQLEQGWNSGPLLTNNPGRLNGTVLDETAWEHTTYLFSQYQSDLPTWFNNDTPQNVKNVSAFQLAIWEVMSGDGGPTGGNWSSGYFTADVSPDLTALANGFVSDAFNAGFSNFTEAQANQAYLLVRPPGFPGLRAAHYRSPSSSGDSGARPWSSWTYGARAAEAKVHKISTGRLLYCHFSAMRPYRRMALFGMPGMCPFSGVQVPYGKGSRNR